MKSVLDLTKAITDAQYYKEQFDGSGTEKNVLFVEPQLTSKHLYKFILPFFSFYNEKVYTAITGLGKYDPYKQIVALETVLTQKEIRWANYIVFPFTTMDLSKPNGLYEAIREVNPNCKIVFFVDFNYYELSDEHPHKELFGFTNILDATEKNILFSDLCLTNNLQLRGYLLKKFTGLADTKFIDVENIPVNFGSIPYLIDEQIVLQNVEFESHKPEPVIINKEIFKKVAEVADDIKKEDLQANKYKAKKVVANSKNAPKKSKVKATKVKSKKVKEEESKVEEAVPEIKSEPKAEIKPLPKKYRVGVICSPNSYSDISFYNDEFQKINEQYGDDVCLVFIGYDYENDKKKILDGVNFEYVKEVSVIHYFKQMQSLELDLVIIPLKKNLYNITSETVNKYLECGLFKIPIIVDDMFPYNQVILNQRNGFLYKGKEVFMQEIDKLLRNPDLIKNVSEQSRKDVMQSYTYNENTIQVISSIYL